MTLANTRSAFGRPGIRLDLCNSV